MATPQASTVVHRGGCLCGALRYEFVGEPLSFVFCHCRDCQTVSGGGPAAILMLRQDAFRLLQGELKTYTRPSDLGPLAHRRFCPHCGTQVLSELDRVPQMIFLKAGTLETPGAFQPSVNLWTRSKQPWTPMDPGLKAFATQP